MHFGVKKSDPGHKRWTYSFRRDQFQLIFSLHHRDANKFPFPGLQPVSNVTKSGRSTTFWFSPHSVCLLFSACAPLATLELIALWQHGLLKVNLFHSRSSVKRLWAKNIQEYHISIHISVLSWYCICLAKPLLHPYFFNFKLHWLFCKMGIPRIYYPHCETASSWNYDPRY